MYCGALGVEFLCVVGVFFEWCGGCHPVSHGVGNLLVFFSLCCILCATLDRNVWAVLCASVVVYRSQSGVELRAL